VRRRRHDETVEDPAAALAGLAMAASCSALLETAEIANRRPGSSAIRRAAATAPARRCAVDDRHAAT
jgi:hypothetical protein